MIPAAIAGPDGITVVVGERSVAAPSLKLVTVPSTAGFRMPAPVAKRSGMHFVGQAALDVDQSPDVAVLVLGFVSDLADAAASKRRCGCQYEESCQRSECYHRSDLRGYIQLLL